MKEDGITRRDVLKTLGAGAAGVAVAGCGGNSTSDETDGDTGSTDRPTETDTDIETATPVETVEKDLNPVHKEIPEDYVLELEEQETHVIGNCDEEYIIRVLDLDSDSGEIQVGIGAGHEIPVEQNEEIDKLAYDLAIGEIENGEAELQGLPGDYRVFERHNADVREGQREVVSPGDEEHTVEFVGRIDEDRAAIKIDGALYEVHEGNTYSEEGALFNVDQLWEDEYGNTVMDLDVFDSNC